MKDWFDVKRERERRIYLDLDLAPLTSLVTYSTITPTLDEISRVSFTCKLKVCSKRMLLRNGELRTRLEWCRCPTESKGLVLDQRF
jgi:hypothetical protein